ncbi:MAG: toxin-antitoxin system HicB family antitoxin [Fimbriimonadaceae bacterium]|nr:toxin-antitoxin system HicB family antitoxin [Fimbriimonadaceae bacterium]
MNKLDKIQSMAIQVVRLPDGSYEASIPQLARSVVGYGDSSETALADMLQVAEATAHFLEEQGEDLPDPEPVPEWTDYSGRVTLRLPKMLHAQLDRLATREGASLNSLLTTILQAGATSLAAGCEFGVAAEPLRRALRVSEGVRAAKSYAKREEPPSRKRRKRKA